MIWKYRVDPWQEHKIDRDVHPSGAEACVARSKGDIQTPQPQL